MPEYLKPLEDFKNMCEENDIEYYELSPGLLFVISETENDSKVNVRQYDVDGGCLSSWINKEDFMAKIKMFIENL